MVRLDSIGKEGSWVIALGGCGWRLLQVSAILLSSRVRVRDFSGYWRLREVSGC